MRTNENSRAVVIKNGKVALLHRKKNGEEYYVAPGGGVEDGETIEQALERELWEETSLKLTKKELWFEDTYNGDRFYYFRCEAEGEKLELLGSEKDSDPLTNWYQPEWVNLEEVKNIKIYPEDLGTRLREYNKW